ncbi:bifunctional glycosyltransferase family 2 protein/CDP-glycerol:glycerophosphate glycerophosphotransferase [Streptomyces sp. LP11]|uniref:Bifunctional glycosyltransferase family 2 protein/CDP-glycerol:glycerophosphate glycerophosphotransferase n=1 Tax=Streptomyces pyxinicus TaxID=2970331 RepID=A0ABT2B254_9ACTN|nr:bifunctional glycosyltransferase family 2 protein/CDP-glycerol:glycerophosphate glycerophosphotransferase [Streptomyces sp. LP11]MCS0602564.1 bifunctional glycosyltransferase family 2 protein/CDP-glycerol:glycerophosphate glycerophosphotransferase [Streptomyces sp. LP11]
MPRFSVIVPAYQVQAYLSECLDSVLSQSYPDLELIAVDDRSPDACGAIIDEYAARDPRVRPVHLVENVGLGGARNAGIAEARGDYLVFLDSDDTLTPGALHAIADRIEATGDPDVLVYDYARTHWDGRTVRNQLAGQLAEEGPAPFRLADRPGLLRVLMVAWNKACRRDFVARHGFTFPPGYYEDTPWTFPVLMAAESVATLDRVCVHYRQRRQGSILGSTSRRHFDLFEQYERVFAYVAEHPELECWRPELYRRMIDHLAVVFTQPGRLPRGSHGDFLRRARALGRRHRVPGVRFGPRQTLVRLGLHRTLRSLRLASALRRRVRRTAGRPVRALRSGALRLHYALQSRLPLRADLAVFAASHGPGDPGALEEAFRAHAPHVRTAWLARPGQEGAVPAGPRVLRPGTAASWSALARARYLVNDGEFGPAVRKRRGQVYVQTRRGTPLLHTGLDLLERPAAARDTDFGELLREVDRWDYLLSGNRHATLTWERVLPGRYTTLEYGAPRTDVLHRATEADVTRLRAALGVPAGAVAVLYAPARRDHRRTQHPPFDLERIARRLGPRFVLLARPHPAHGGPLGTGPGIIDVGGHPSPAELCLASDVLLTDRSSLMVDHADLDRPVVLHTGELAVVEAVRGTYVDLRACPPGTVADSEDELIDVLVSGRWCDARSARLRAEFRERFCPYDDGRAAERVVRRVVLGERAGLPVAVPLAERKPVPPAVSRAPWATVPQPSGPPTVTESR